MIMKIDAVAFPKFFLNLEDSSQVSHLCNFIMILSNHYIILRIFFLREKIYLSFMRCLYRKSYPKMFLSRTSLFVIQFICHKIFKIFAAHLKIVYGLKTHITLGIYLSKLYLSKCELVTP